MNKCPICDKTYKQYQGRKRLRCNSCNTKIRRTRTTLAAIAYLGGHCSRCEEQHPACLEFHHKDPSTKDFTIGSVANKSWDFVVKELDKCELLCSNCHRKEHAERYNKEFLEHCKNYAGKNSVLGGIDWDKYGDLA